MGDIYHINWFYSWISEASTVPHPQQLSQLNGPWTLLNSVSFLKRINSTAVARRFQGLGECEPTTPLSVTFKNWDSHHLLSSPVVSIYFKQLKVKFLSNMFLTNPCRLNVPILGLSKLFVSFSGKKTGRMLGKMVGEWLNQKVVPSQHAHRSRLLDLRSPEAWCGKTR